MTILRFLLVCSIATIISSCSSDEVTLVPGTPGATPILPGAGEATGKGESRALGSAELRADKLDLPASERKFVVDPSLTAVVFEDVKLSEAATIQPSAALVSSPGSIGEQVFDSAKLSASHGPLKAGDILIVPGRVLGKVTSVKSGGGKTTVKTSFASLTDAFTNLRWGWESALPVGAGNLAAFVMPNGKHFPAPRPTMYAANGAAGLPQGPMEWSLADGPLTYKVRLDAQQTHIELVTQVTRKMANTGGMTYTGKVRIKPIDISGSGSIAGGKAKAFDIKQKEIGGEVTISVAAAGGGRSEIKKDLPMPLFKWIVMVGPIPVVITAKVRLIGRVDLPAKGSSVASADFSFSGSAGFKYAGSKIEAKAAFPKGDFKADKPFDAAGFINGAADAQFGVAFPVLSMGMFDSFFVPELTPGAQAGVRLTWGPICKTGYMLYTLKASYDFKVLGVSLSQGKKPLFEKRKDSKGNSCRTK